MCYRETPKERVERRFKDDPRLYDEKIYTEKHHIIPRHSGGSDEENNLVVLLPEEHLIAHMLLFKIYKNRNDMLASRFMLNGHNSRCGIRLRNNKGYSSYRTTVQNFRNKTGWHTEEGLKNISDNTSGMSYCKNDMGEYKWISVTSDEYLSGEFYHHTKGFLSVVDKYTSEVVRVSVDEYRNNKEKYTTLGNRSGSSNGNYKHMDESKKNEIMSYFVSSCVENGFSLSGKLMSFLKDEYNLSITWFKKHFGGMDKFVSDVNRLYGTKIIYNKYYKSEAHRRSLSQVNMGKKKNVKN